jgi:hypothetical protein
MVFIWLNKLGNTFTCGDSIRQPLLINLFPPNWLVNIFFNESSTRENFFT